MSHFEQTHSILKDCSNPMDLVRELLVTTDNSACDLCDSDLEIVVGGGQKGGRPRVPPGRTRPRPVGPLA